MIKLVNILKELEDFDLSDNPIPNKVVSSYTYEVPEFEIDLSDKGEHWMVDVEVMNLQYASGKMKWVTKVVKATDMTGFPNHVIEYNPTTKKFTWGSQISKTFPKNLGLDAIMGIVKDGTQANTDAINTYIYKLNQKTDYKNNPDVKKPDETMEQYKERINIYKD
jgi:hypothetical protein